MANFLENFLGSVLSQFGLGKPGGQGGTQYVPTGQSDVDKALQQLFSGLSGAIGGTQAQIQPNIVSGYQNAPDLSALSQLYQSALQNQATNAYGQVAPLQRAGQQVFNTAQDPQQALYNQLQQQTQDQSRAATSARGIGMGGDAAGIENQAMKNFNIDWQNQQLQRQLSGLQGMGQAYDTSGRQNLIGNQDLTSAMGMAQGGAMWPFQLANAFGDSMGQNVYQPWSNMGNMYANYLGMGSGASQGAFGQGGAGITNLGSLFQSPSVQNALSSIFGSGAGTGLGYGTADASQAGTGLIGGAGAY